MGESKSIFAKYVAEPEKERPPEKIPRGPLLKPVVPPTDINSPPVEKLLDWLVNRWPKPTVTTKNILQFGPNPLRNRKHARPTAEILAQNGWLTPLKTRCYIDREWRIERGPSDSTGSSGSGKKAP
jgi:hypothetical protein